MFTTSFPSGVRRDRNFFNLTFEIRHVVAGDARRVPSLPAGNVEQVELIASCTILVQIDLPVFLFSHSIVLQDAPPARRASQDPKCSNSFAQLTEAPCASVAAGATCDTTTLRQLCGIPVSP